MNLKWLIRFLKRPIYQQWLILRISASIICVRVMLRFVPFKRLLGWMQRSSPLKRVAFDADTAQYLSHNIEVIGNVLIPKGPCLTKALVGRWFLNQIGYETTMHFGVRYGNNQQLEAHAWLEHDGEIVIGNLVDLESYKTIHVL